MSRHNTLPPLQDVRGKLLQKIRPDEGPHGCAPANAGVGTHIDLPSPLHSYPSITGHDLMAMFPPKSPQTVRTNGGASCTVFAQQERAFLSNPHKLPSAPTAGHRATDHANPNESTKSTAPQAPTTAMSLNGDWLPDDGKGGSKAAANNDHRSAERGLHFQKSRSEDSGDTTRRRPRSDSTKAQRTHDVSPANMRRARKRSCSREIPEVGEIVLQQEGRESARASVTAIHARRLDKQTGLTFIETKYKEENTPAFIFVNVV
ncbi:hypothetical protein PHLGIDRAFT_377791 [Phlebiopsis gigantea 11061_1 CR5-6]|uniref:Uncharacterized protein n=1 Tax=Phlebiopsis gigantea (strain 11061_1 CR5-6) TaxID=745531 RepID=A0A0C3S9M9_PHLG1|nr:hypothetical protein PHLGIDRAFT_377791 [Phlebiopsis gigantea 11061_1 CR5-6]